MATTTVQRNSIMLSQQKKLQTEQNDEDIVLANYLSSSLRFDQSQQRLWNFTTHYNTTNTNTNNINNTTYYIPQQQQPIRPYQQRTRISNNSTFNYNYQPQPPIQVQKSISTPNISQQRRSSTSSQHTQRKRHTSSSLIQSPSSSSEASSKDMNNTIQTERRPSISSIQSEVSINTKSSISKRIRKVFSMNNLKGSSSSTDLASLADKNDSNSSVSSSMVGSPLSTCSFAAGDEKKKSKSSFKRRSIASLSNLFHKTSSSIAEEVDETSNYETVQQKNVATISSNNSSSTAAAATTSSSQQMDDRRHSTGDLRQLVKDKKKEKRPTLKVDTSKPTHGTASLPNVRKGGLKVRSSTSSWNTNTNMNSVAPDSPNSIISSRSSFTRLPPPPPQQRNFIQLPEPGLPSPTSSVTSSIKQNEEDNHNYHHHPHHYTKPSVGFHYGSGLHHGSPRLKPASSSDSSLIITTGRRIQFCSTIQVHETFSSGDYDRRCDTNATCQKLTPMMAMKIKQELNEYKLSEMEVHVESRQYTHFFL
ncbi:uncharacterized protein BX663DRAFT_492123 [Cokeromyces recurvatus]|uniref:uncharacterized protein n=1 Tax=Cokeromyces recurvatus TaxID=90255 RepID=UPI00221E704A|nr:uncharacterized protein BX663DRAFT_492123 [Cokeromyces recurvatus]KAI7907828.1 hypothetical protein BX663DRAFT_492123 [Cokeromyces recurvatus]